MTKIKIFIEYAMTSLSSTVVEYVFFLFCLFMSQSIQISTYIGKFISCCYQYFINEKYIFKSTNNLKRAFFMFILLNVFKGFVSANVLEYLSLTYSGNIIVFKMIVDVILFFMTYHVSKKYIF